MTDRTYPVVVTFTVREGGDKHLQTRQVIEQEVQSWLESLNVTVHGVNVHRESPKD